MSEKREILLGAGIDFNVKTGPNITQSTSILSTHHKVILLPRLHLCFLSKDIKKHRSMFIKDNLKKGKCLFLNKNVQCTPYQ